MTRGRFLFGFFGKAGRRSKRSMSGKADENEEVQLAKFSSQSKPLDDTWTDIQKAKQAKQPEVKSIYLERLLLDASEYHSLVSMAVQFIWGSLFVGVLFAQMGISTGTFKNSIVESLATWNAGNPWEHVTLDGIDSLEDGYNYTAGYMQSRINFTNYAVGTQDFSQNVIYLSPFAQLSYARVAVDFESNCRNGYRVRLPPGTPPKNRMPRCYKDIDNLPTNVTATVVPAGGVKPDADYSDFTSDFEQYKDRKAAIYRIPLATYNSTREAVFSAVNALNEGSNYRAIAKYAGAITLEMLAVNRVGKGSALVRLSFRGAKPTGGLKLLHQIAVYTVRDHYTILEILCAILFLVGTVFFILEEFYHRQLYYWQTGSSWAGYFSSKWNMWFNACYLFNLIWILCWAALFYQRQVDYWLEHTKFSVVVQRAESYTQWLYFGDILMIYIGVCMCRFMRVHRGLGVFYALFITSFRSIADFSMFVIYVLVVFGSTVFVFFTISGGNSQFLTWTDSISAISRFGFGFLDYLGFSNSGLGLGQYTALVTLVFWLAVIFLGVFMQNILLAIFSNAYDAERNNALEVEYSFMALIYKRTCFALRWLMLYRIKRRWRPQSTGMSLAQCILGDEYNKDPEELYGMKKTERLRNSIQRHTTTQRLLTGSSRRLDGTFTTTRLGVTIGHIDSSASTHGAPASEAREAQVYGDPINYEKLQERYVLARYAVVQSNDMRDLARYFTNFRTRKLVDKGRMNWKLLEQLEVTKKIELGDTYLAKIPNREDYITERELALLLAFVRKHRDMLSFRAWFLGTISKVLPFGPKYHCAPYYTKDESMSAAIPETTTPASATSPEAQPSTHVTIEILPTIQSKAELAEVAELPPFRRSASLPHVDEAVEKMVQVVVCVYAYVHRLKRGQPTSQKKEMAALMEEVVGVKAQLNQMMQLMQEMSANSRAVTRQATRNPSTLGGRRSLLGSI